MKHSLIAAAVLALTLTACGKKEEAVAPVSEPAPAPAAAPAAESAPAAAPTEAAPAAPAEKE